MKNATILHQVALPALALLLSACAGQPPGGGETTSAIVIPPPVHAQPEPGPTPPSANQVLLASIALQLRELDQLTPTAAALAQLDPSLLSAAELASYRELQIHLHYLEGELQRAEQVAEMALAELAAGSVELWPIQQWRLRLLRGGDSTLHSARYGASLLGRGLDSERRTILIDQVWHDLQSTPLGKIQEERDRAGTGGQWQAWLELAMIHSRRELTPGGRNAAWQRWQGLYPQHPAALAPPDGVGQQPTETPASVALVLPMSGPLAAAGAAIVDGFLGALFEARAQSWPSQTLDVLDVNDFSDVSAAYGAAIASGAELIVGPLSRQRLSQWRADVPVPVLALNWFEHTAANLYQMALAPEDEASQLARLAYGKGARRALLIHSADSFGTTVYQSFTQAWSQQRGTIAARAVYSGRDDYSSSLRDALGLVGSEQRAKQISQALGAQLEFSPRRRRDIDSVFLLTGNASEARALKPLLAYHYAGNLPVYSTSHVFSGQPNPRRDRDLNGILLVEAPWLLDFEDEMKEQLSQHGRLSAMAALGADAFLLHWRLAPLRINPGYRVRGHGGLLSMDAEGRIHRQLQPARMIGGVPVAGYD